MYMCKIYMHCVFQLFALCQQLSFPAISVAKILFLHVQERAKREKIEQRGAQSVLYQRVCHDGCGMLRHLETVAQAASVKSFLTLCWKDGATVSS